MNFTGNTLLDMDFTASSMKNMSEDEIIKKYEKAYFENPILSIKWLFYAGDVREGLGEGRLFKACFKYIAENKPEAARALIELVPKYTGWDNLLCLLDTPVGDDAAELISKQLASDIENMSQSKPVSLLAKRLPSENASSPDTRETARKLICRLKLTEENYRKLLSRLRAYLEATETYSCGKAKIKAGVLFPHDIFCKYRKNIMRSYAECSIKIDTVLEELWKALPDYINGNGSTICAPDCSLRMRSRIGETKVTCKDAAFSLAVYFGERLTGEFKNKFIGFREEPLLEDLSYFPSSVSDYYLVPIVRKYALRSDMGKINIERALYLILETAVKGKMNREDMPSNLLVISDRDFDLCVTSNSVLNKGLFEVIGEKYKSRGYSMPKLVFWNISGEAGVVPPEENGLGVCLVSGFNPTVVRMLLSNKTDPYEALTEQLNAERYAPVEEKLKLKSPNS